MFNKIEHHIAKLPRHKIVVYIVSSIVIISVIFSGYRCAVTQICTPHFFEQFVRKDALIATSKGLLKAEVVDTPETRAEGLSGRASLSKEKGMLFSFGVPGKYGFWMKDMQFPLDIIWINSKGIIVYMVENAQPSDYPATYINDVPASFVLEINAGEAKSKELYLGSKVDVFISKK